MDDHVAANLPDVETVVPYLQQTNHLIGNDVEDEDVERVVARIDEELLQAAFVPVEPEADVVGHQEAE